MGCLSAGAVEPKPKHVFIKAGCSGPLSTEIISSLRDAIRASPGYELTTNLADDGGYKVVITLYLVCVEKAMPNSEPVVSVASIFGRGTCTLGSCNVTSDESTLEASLCSGKMGQGCGRDIYTEMDEYMSGRGGYAFDALSKARQ